MAQHFAKLLARIRAGFLADQGVQQPFLGLQLGLGRDFLAQAFAHHGDGDLEQVADDLLHVPADIADLGELGRLHLEERRLRQAREAAGDLGLADAGGADHQDVLRQHLLAQLLGQLQAPPAVAKGDGDGALGLVLADDEAIQLGNDLSGAEGGGIGGLHKHSITSSALVWMQIPAAIFMALRAMASASSESSSIRARAAARA